MGGNTEHIQGHGFLTLGQAVHKAQNSDGGIDQHLANHLEKKLAEVWGRVNREPDSYILQPDEFALFNYYKSRFEGEDVARKATQRFWDNHHA